MRTRKIYMYTIETNAVLLKRLKNTIAQNVSHINDRSRRHPTVINSDKSDVNNTVGEKL